ncbi:hypothetical protein BP6252_03861 [Coleophoma cylindrospora]|uniref:NACHT domain-containing protein n=1 Tax=Coleophoma cylindrospora TaxID=1849047 RepID=A0A3D8S8S5_9HELO|nr:hypothetical protein BP6252_03861 [Coleophoma cylindrospora]
MARSTRVPNRSEGIPENLQLDTPPHNSAQSLESSSDQKAQHAQAKLKSPSEYAYRVSGIPLDHNIPMVKELVESKLLLHPSSNQVEVKSLAFSTDNQTKVATISFTEAPISLTRKDGETFHIPELRDPAVQDSDDLVPRPLSITVDDHFIGLTTLYCPSAEDHKFDLIAISGLGGHAFGSFKERGGSHMWLRDSLPHDIKSCRVLIYGYNTQVQGSQSFQDLEALGSTLRTSIESMNEVKPLIFIAHSLGGLIVKQALIQMGSGSDESQRIIHSTYGVLFFGVPNQGMKIESFLPIVKQQPNASLLYTLGTESQLLREQSRAFQKVFDFQDSKVFCFYETLESPTAEQKNGKLSMTGRATILVGSSSATHGRSWESQAHHIQAINRNHSDLVKFRNTDEVYSTVLAKIKSFTTEASKMRFPRRSQAEVNLERKVVNWLHPPDASSNHNRASLQHQQGTGKWFTDCSRFQEWKKNPGSFLWLYGIPGCGKTILMSKIIDQVQSHCQSNSRSAVAYYYFDFNDKEKQNVENLFRSIIVQISLQSFKIPKPLTDLYSKFYEGRNQPSCYDLSHTLSGLFKEHGQVYILLDALDECKESSELLNWIKEIFKHYLSQLHLIVASRKERDIEMTLSKYMGVDSIDIINGDVASDITAFIEHRLAEDDALKCLPDNIKANIIRVLTGDAKGMQVASSHYGTSLIESRFRWVSCQLDVLSTCKSAREVKSALESLPKTLDETYARALEKIEAANGNANLRDTTIRILQWLVYSEVPLRINEIAEIRITKPGQDAIVDVEDRPFDLDDITVHCGSLVTTQKASRRELKSDRPMTNESCKELRLAHFSVQEYLISNRIVARCPHYSISEPAAQLSIAGTCLNYLWHFKNLPYLPANTLDEFPLAGYAAQYWFEHIRKIDPKVDRQDIDQRVVCFLEHQKVYNNWIQLHNPDEPSTTPNLGYKIDHKAEPLYCTSLLGLIVPIRILLIKGADVNASLSTGPYGSALAAAAAYGDRVDVVQVLLEAGADVNASLSTGHYGSALAAAAADGGGLDVVQVLLEAGADVNASLSTSDYGSALVAAASRGGLDVVQVILEAGADVNASPSRGPYGSALAAAASRDRLDVVQVLLDAGADVNACLSTGDYGSALAAAVAAAAFGGGLDVVQVLLEAGADVNASLSTGDYGSALAAAAAYGGGLDVVQVLLEAGADVNASLSTGDYGSALAAATYEGGINIVQVLLEAGADVNASLSTGDYGSALAAAAAAYEGGINIVQVLLEAGADVNASLSTGDYGSALAAAAYEGELDIIQVLLEAGADVNAHLSTSKYGSSALKVAESRGKQEVVQLLVKAGADINAAARNQ